MGFGRYGGKVSGTVGLSCARHMFVLPGGGVDLQKGERFANVDFAMLSGLQPWMNLRTHVSGYDINCQYGIHFDKRMTEIVRRISQFPSMSFKYFPNIVRAIGKFHLPAHKALCRWKFSYHWLPGVGMTDGEAPERIWATLNALGARTREMTAGHRHDVINDHHSDMNVRQVHGIGSYLSGMGISGRLNIIAAKDLAKKHSQAIEQETAT
ncbi:hypothetical protein WOLCODRAFT_62365 [Wolfiporia cocos MD-104 SS10]|uniref:Uncharacterized protein n=1 Tax=Wolfiporia cocos (strain MD-104) TaxID=742152 RepID=A0A2H3JEL6_WOLCO|nr:hypothetical protein WOLCODRAFT_62365 [Wolfiporia cocos MD-104 SS10]